MSTISKSATLPRTKSFYSPKTLIMRFTAERTFKGALIWGAIFALYMIAKTSSYVRLYPTDAARQKLAETLGGNVGVEALLGIAHKLETVGGYAAWNFLCLITAAGAVWALLIATKTFRGEEDAGRAELMLAGQTTARRAAANKLIGLFCGLGVLFIFMAVSATVIARMGNADLTRTASLFFAVSLVAGAAEFLAIGALTSQLMPVRSRAAGSAAAIFGIFYLLRLTADTTNARWLLNITPLGWIERLQPLYNSQPLWLIPIGGFVVVISLLAIWLAGHRDVGAATFADKDVGKPRTSLLSSAFATNLRLNRSSIIGWVSAIGLTAFFYGLLAKGAVKAFSQSVSAERAIKHLTHGSSAITATQFMGATFFLAMIQVAFYSASAIGRMREDEAQGYLDNFLVRPVSRARLFWGRLFMIACVLIVAGVLSGLLSWVGEASQHAGVPLHLLLEAGINAVVPAVLVLAVGAAVVGILPRLTSAITYGVIAWSFLVTMLSSGLNLNHWLIDTSVLHQVTLAPSVSPDWHVDTVIVIIALGLCLLGAIGFSRRDLASE